VTVLDVATLEIRKKIAVGGTRTAVARRRWIPLRTSDDIHLIATSSDTVVKQVAVPQEPAGMRFTADSRHLFVASGSPRRLGDRPWPRCGRQVGRRPAAVGRRHRADPMFPHAYSFVSRQWGLRVLTARR